MSFATITNERQATNNAPAYPAGEEVAPHPHSHPDPKVEPKHSTLVTLNQSRAEQSVYTCLSIYLLYRAPQGTKLINKNKKKERNLRLKIDKFKDFEMKNPTTRDNTNGTRMWMGMWWPDRRECRRVCGHAAHFTGCRLWMYL